MEEKNPIKLENIWRNPDGTFKKGHPSSGGRPLGKTLKEYAKDYLMSLPDEEKTEFLASLPADIVWRMAEGNPKQDTDLTSGGKPIIQLAKEIIEKNDINASPESNSTGQT